MASRKGQMFVVTAVFLTGMLFAVQQAMLSYTLIDMSSPFHGRENSMIMNFVDVVNQSIITQIDTGDPNEDCLEFESNLKIVMAAMKDRMTGEGIMVDTIHSLDCANWLNAHPASAPLNLTLIFSGYYDSTGTFSFYHVQ